jgi:hypothetical protein
MSEQNEVSPSYVLVSHDGAIYSKHHLARAK